MQIMPTKPRPTYLSFTFTIPIRKMPNYFIFNLDLWVHETIVENYPQDPQLLGWEIDAFCIVNTRATNLLLARCTSPSAPNWPFCDLQFEIPGLETN